MELLTTTYEISTSLIMPSGTNNQAANGTSQYFNIAGQNA